MSKVTDFIKGIKEAREAKAEEKSLAKYKGETLEDGLKYWSERANEYGVARDQAIADGKTNIGYKEYSDGTPIGEVYKDQNGGIYQSCISALKDGRYMLETLTKVPTRDGGSQITRVGITDASAEKLISYQNSSKPLTVEEIVEKINTNDIEAWHGRVDKDDNIVPTGNEMLLDSMTKKDDLIECAKGAEVANAAFKAFEDVKIETLQAQAAQGEAEE